MQVNWPVLFKRPAEPLVPQVSDKLQFVDPLATIGGKPRVCRALLLTNVYFLDKRHAIDLVQRGYAGEHFLQGRLAQAF